jgi:hypothetical protein
MRLARVLVAVVALGVLAVAGISVLRGNDEPATGLVVFTQVPAGAGGPLAGNGAARRYPAGSRIVAFDPQAPDGNVRVLTKDFYSARAPAISSDGKRMVFSGQRREDSPWQIWEMQLERRRTKPLTRDDNAYTDPAYLADGRIVFSARTSDYTTTGGETAGSTDENDSRAGAPHALYTSDPEGGDVTRITFHPGFDFAPTVLRDGRLLFATRASSSSPASRLFTVRSDGTAAELFYQSRQGGRQNGRAWETPDGRVVFVESGDWDTTGGDLVAVSQRRPLHSRVALSSGVKGTFHSVFPLSSDEFLVSYRPPGADRFGVYEFEPSERRLEPLLANDPGYDAVEPVALVERPDPKTFVSVVDEQRKTGELYGLDADLSDLPVVRSATSSGPSVSVRVGSAAGTLGEVPLEADRSFYIEIPADTPVRLETLDAAGRVVRGPSAWIWVRPDERRGCIGCHEDRELAPENRVPLAVEKPPVSLSAAPSPVADEESHRSDGAER